MKKQFINVQLFAEPVANGVGVDEEGTDLTDEDIAELANRELRRKNEENARLRKELAKAKLFSEAEEDDEELPTAEECIKVISNSNTNNYDYAVATCNLVDIRKEEGAQNPLGKNGDAVYKFFKDIIDACGDDKSRFASIYQANIANDPVGIGSRR